MDGKSMARSIAAGVASMVKLMFPNYNYLQIIEHIKATAISIDAKNPQYSGNLGTGRVDAYAAVSNEDVRSVTLNNYSYTDTNNDGVLDIGETIEISCEFLNVLKPVKNARVKARSMSLFKPQFIVSEVELGDLQTNDLKIPKDKFSFVVPENIPIDYTMDIEFFVTDDNGFCGRELVPFVFRPSYRTMDANNISVTFNSIGNIGFNDYSNNEQGKGFIYGNSQNLLFEGALMIGVSPYKISNVARGSNQSYKDLSFSTDNIFILKNPGNEAELEGMANFNDLSFLDGIGVDIKQTVYQFNEDGKKDFIICVYDIHNKSDNDFDSLFVGLFFDWDIGPSGANNQANFDDEYYFGYVQNVQIDTIPLAGVKMLSFQKLNYYAIDNDGNYRGDLGVYDGFSKEEKWLCISSGLKRKISNVTDASHVISAGPINLKKNDSTRIAFSLFSGYSVKELRENAYNSYITAKQFNLSEWQSTKLPTVNCIEATYPNPTYKNNVSISYNIIEKSNVNIDIYDSNGKFVDSILKNKSTFPGVYNIEFDTSYLTQGLYYVILNTGNGKCFSSFTLVR